MALNKAVLITTLTDIFSDTSKTATAASKATSIANAIDTFVKSGQVDIGITAAGVVTTGVGAGGAVTTTTNSTGTIS